MFIFFPCKGNILLLEFYSAAVTFLTQLTVCTFLLCALFKVTLTMHQELLMENPGDSYNKAVNLRIKAYKIE